MNNVIYKTKGLVREIKTSNEYNQYRRLQKKLAENKEIYDKLGEFRRKSFQLQTGGSSTGLFGEIEDLRREYEDILSLPLVIDFFVAEQRICSLMQNVYETILESLNFDIDFLEQ